VPDKRDIPYIAAQNWANTIGLEYLRRSKAPDIARSYGIPEDRALRIIVETYRRRTRHGQPTAFD
jgi:hypothetical protein